MTFQSKTYSEAAGCFSKWEKNANKFLSKTLSGSFNPLCKTRELELISMGMMKSSFF